MKDTIFQQELLEETVKWVGERPVTFQQFREIFGPKDQVELVDGVVVERTLPQLDHEKLLSWLRTVLGIYAEARRLGIVLGSRTAVEIHQYRGRLPELLFVREDWMEIVQQKAVYGAPDLIIEVISPNDRASDVIALETDYRAIGVAEIVFFDQRKHRVRLLRKQANGYSEEALTTGTVTLESLEGLQLELEWHVGATPQPACDRRQDNKMENLIDLTIPEHSYLFGFLQGDGHLYQNPNRRRKGQLSVELGAGDRGLLQAFQRLIPCYTSVNDRHRDTNFKEDYISSVWSVSHYRFREELIRLGLPTGRKSENIAPPATVHSEVDYYRGLIDADGSLGREAQGLPFVSLTTSSDAIAATYQDFLFRLTGKRKTQRRNRRDSVYNIMVWKEDAQAVVSLLYYPSCLSLHRKYQKALEVLAWVRPSGMKRVENRRAWTPDQDEYVLSHTTEVAMDYLARNRDSVILRRRRLRSAQQKERSTG